MSDRQPAQVLLTGVTGFVGKVVLQQLLARRQELNVERIRVLIRENRGRHGRLLSANERFLQVTQAEVFRQLPANWPSFVEVVTGNLGDPRCGLDDEDFANAAKATTHIIHCAASVEFDLPVAEAAAANITTALNVLALAQACPSLYSMVDVSTAYVSVWHSGEIREELAHLPRPATEYYAAVTNATRPEAELLAETGHPNTYTFTKCITEHLLSERRGTVPLTIVRPSIVSAAWRDPFAGWVDSPAALAGCLLYTGLGLVRAFKADPSVRLDVVPVDATAQVIVASAFAEQQPAATSPCMIRYAVMGKNNALRVDMAARATIEFFRQRPGSLAVPGMFIGRDDHGFEQADLVRRGLRNRTLRTLLLATRKDRERRRLDKVDEKVRYLNSAFRYFTHHTFNFCPKQPIVLPDYDPVAYSEVINHGLYRHLLKLDPTQMPLAGASHNDAQSDFVWALGRQIGSRPMQALAVGLRKALRRCTSGVTFDRPSFERAVKAAPPDALFILAPSHRSYFDFLLSSYLCFQHPELRIAVPHIAAADEFGRIPLVGSILRASRAFYIRRGVGKEVPELSEELRRIAARDASVMFFIEGQRSRGRLFLSPKRGLLRGLQATGRTFAILPISIAYDRVPEEPALERELSGGRRSRMSLHAIVRWLGDLTKNNIQLGRIHLSCGDVLTLNSETEVPVLARAVVAEQQQHMAITRFHLRTFLATTTRSLFDEEQLTAAIARRGGQVLASDLPPPPVVSAQLARSLQNQWIHWFYGDALALFPESIAVADHIARHGWTKMTAPLHVDDALLELVTALMAPIAHDYELVAGSLHSWGPLGFVPPAAFVAAHPGTHLPYVEDCYQALAERKIMVPSLDAKSGYAWGTNAHLLAEFHAGCALHPSLKARRHYRNQRQETL